jgi:branched-chain amino acid transport system permease protein
MSGLVATLPPSRAFGVNRVVFASIFLLVLPWIAPFPALAINLLVFGLYALAFNLLYGYLGLLSLGHAALFGGGAYACGIALTRFGLPWWGAIAAGIAAGWAVALIIGLLATRTRGIYFAMVTLALAQCFYFVMYQASDWTGGENGLRGVNLKEIRLPGITLDFLNPIVRYYVLCAFVIAALIVLSRILASPFGAAMEAVRENESRARACGYNIAATRLQAFTLSGAFAGLAGALYALHLSIVPIELLDYSTSGLAVMMALLGGAGTFFGPFVGAAVFVLMENIVSLYTEHWQLFVGLVFMACVLFFPKGIWGTVLQRAGAWKT